jgi:hypothetical protein
MSFLEAPHVKIALDEITFLRERLNEQARIILTVDAYDKGFACEYLHTLFALTDKEHALYTRFRLSDDAEALQAASLLDGPQIAAKSGEYRNGDHFYRELKKGIKDALSKLDDVDMDEPFQLW